MKKILLIMFLLSASLFGDYIKDASKYQLIEKNPNDYMLLIEEAYADKIYTKEQLQEALKKDDIHPLSDIFRILAFDEYSKFSDLEKHIKFIEENDNILKKFPNLALALADVLLRVGEYDKVLKTISREEIVAFPTEQKNKGYYYRALAKFLKNEEISQEFFIIKYKYNQTKEIYKEVQAKRKKEESAK